MSASPDTLLQVNLKTPTGTLLNVYGKDEQSLDYGLALLHDRINTIVELEQALSGASNVAAVVPLHPQQPAPPSVQAAAPAAAAPPLPPQPAASFAAATNPSCQHGPKTARSGQGSKGPWKAWMCPAPKGTPGQCEPVWVRQGSPEWSTFPA